MKLEAVSGVMLTLLLIGMLTLAFNIQPVRAGTIIVPDDYPTIQAAINAANLGDIIYVKEGTYYENVVVNKTVSLIGENRSTTIVDGLFGTGFRVISDYVNISDFTIRNCGPPEGGPLGGIHLDSSNNCKISGNTIKNSNFGIWPDVGSSNFIFNNTLSRCGYAIGGPFLPSSGNNHHIFNNFIINNSLGIYLTESRNSIVSNNTILNSQRQSIYLLRCSNITLTNNNMTGNIYSLKVYGNRLSHFIHDIDVSNTVDGKPVYYLINQKNLIIDPFSFPDIGYLGLVNSTKIVIKNLNLTRSGQGLLLAYTTYSTVMHVNASFNRIGIDLFGSSDNTIISNIITSNLDNGINLNFDCNRNTIRNNSISNNGGAAILMDESDSNIIKCNTLSKNDYGIALVSCHSNTIYHNKFIENAEQVLLGESPSIWDNGYPSGGNYWSDYTGVDVKSGPDQDQLGSDGIGDTPYVIDENNQDNYPLMYIGPYHQLTIKSSPITGIQFTINGAPKTTPYTEWLIEGSYTLEMPQTHKGYVWSHWLEDGTTNRIKTIFLQGTTWTAVYTPAPPPPSVGGKATPINIPTNKPELQIPWIWLTTIILSLVLTIAYFKKRKRNTRTLFT